MSLYQSLTDKIYLLEHRIKEKSNREQTSPWYLNLPQKEKTSFFRSLNIPDTSDHLKLGFYKLLLALTRIWLVIKGTPPQIFGYSHRRGRMEYIFAITPIVTTKSSITKPESNP
jgi:hypothetical protein